MMFISYVCIYIYINGCVTENVVYPEKPNGFADQTIPMKNCYFIGNINPTFSDKSKWGKTPKVENTNGKESMGIYQWEIFRINGKDIVTFINLSGKDIVTLINGRSSGSFKWMNMDE